MSRQRTAKEIGERALRAIGAFPVTESAADGEQLREAMDWLDIIMSHRAGVERVFSLVPATLSIPLTAGQSEYTLFDALGADLPLDRVQFPVEAWLEDASGNRSDVKIVTRDTFEAIPNAADAGTPTMIHIDRLPAPKMRTYPTIAADDTTQWTLKLVVQTFAPNVAPGGVTGSQPSASILTNFSQAWQFWLIFTLASTLGSGPIFKLPQASINNFDKKATDALTELRAFENREHEDTPPVSEAWGL